MDESRFSRVEVEKSFLEWKGPARPYRKAGLKMIGAPMVIVVLVGLVLLVAMEWMLIIVMAALVFAYYAWMVVPAETIDYKITSRGIRMGEKLYEWENLYRWWIAEQWGFGVLVIETPSLVMGRLCLTLGEAERAQVVEVMERMLLHEQPSETRMDKAGKWLASKFPLAESKS